MREEMVIFARRRRRRSSSECAPKTLTMNRKMQQVAGHRRGSLGSVRRRTIRRLSMGHLLEYCAHLMLILALQHLQLGSSSLLASNNHNQADFQLRSAGNSLGQLANSSNSNSANSLASAMRYGQQQADLSCSSGLLTFELSTGFIYKPASAETLAMMPSTLQLTDCLEFCLNNSSCLAINFEMGLCVLLSSSAKQNPSSLYSSQFPVFTIYAEKICLLAGDSQLAKQRRRCQRAWTFERVAGYEMKTRPKRRLKVASKEHCMEACLIERDFECRSANWYRQASECTLSDQDRHSVSQSEAGDQRIKSSLNELYGPSNLTGPAGSAAWRPALPAGLYQNYYAANGRDSAGTGAAGAFRDRSAEGAPVSNLLTRPRGGRKLKLALDKLTNPNQHLLKSQIAAHQRQATNLHPDTASWPSATNDPEKVQMQQQQQLAGEQLPALAQVDYLENNCVYEPNKLCEFRKIQNRVLKTVDSIYQDVANLEECKQRCLNAPYRCYSFDYGDTSDRVCRTSHLDQASLLSVKEPYLDVMGAITYELAACFNVTVQCRAREMVVQVSSSKMFRGRVYAKLRPNTCVNDVSESLQFELSMRYHDHENCDVKSSSNSQRGVFSSDIVIQHHDRIVTTQDVGLSIYCQYDLGNKSITNNVDLAIERIPDVESKTQQQQQQQQQLTQLQFQQLSQSGSAAALSQIDYSPLTITSLATTVVRSPNVTMRITNMSGQPVSSATVGDRLALLFEIKEKSSPFGIFVREIIAMDGRQVLAAALANKLGGGYHYGASGSLQANQSQGQLDEQRQFQSELLQTTDGFVQQRASNSVQFIDSDGCPTDSNIMGPLVRMDPAGQRILAPFDAFKFPTSDLVFFRAVVSSCVSECKPALCSSPVAPVRSSPSTPSLVSSSSSSASQVSNYITTEALRSMTPTTRLPTTATLFTFKDDQEVSSLASTRNMPTISYASSSANDPTSQQSTPLDSVTARPILGSPTPQMQTTQSAATTTTTTPTASTALPPITTTQPNRSSPSYSITEANKPIRTTASEAALTAGDSLTTVAGFGSREPISGWQGEQAATSSMDLMQPLNITSNHFGKTPPRPPVALAAAQQVNLSSLTLDQKQLLVRLFESRLKQQQLAGELPGGSSNPLASRANHSAATLSEVADLYTGFLTSLMLNNASQAANGEQDDFKRNEPGSAFLQRQSSATASYEQLALARNALNLQEPQQKQQPQQQQQQAGKSEWLENLLASLVEEIRLNSSERENHLDSNAVRSNDSINRPNPFEALSTPKQTTANAYEPTRAESLFGDQDLALGATYSPSGPAVSIAQQFFEHPDGYANGLAPPKVSQSSGERQSRRKRDAKRTESDEASLSARVYLLEQQRAELAPSVAGRVGGEHLERAPARFTQSLIEMYHHNPTAESNLRTKRESSSQQPFYDLDELVVQSIKIVDRLQFQEETSKTPKRGSSNRRDAAARLSPPPAGQQLLRSALVTGAPVPLQSHHQRAGDTSNWPLIGAVWRSFSGLAGLVLLAIAFVFVQTFLLLVYLIDCNLKRNRRGEPNSSAIKTTSISSASSSVSSSSTSAPLLIQLTPPLSSVSQQLSSMAFEEPNYHHHISPNQSRVERYESQQQQPPPPLPFPRTFGRRDERSLESAHLANIERKGRTRFEPKKPLDQHQQSAYLTCQLPNHTVANHCNQFWMS